MKLRTSAWLVFGVVALILFGSVAMGQCPPGAKFCPKPARSFPWAIADGTASPGRTAARLSWAEGNGQNRTISSGSGTVIDGSPENGLILTAAHVLPPGHRELRVELFAVGRDRTWSKVGELPGRPLGRDKARDVGLVSIRPGRALPASPICPEGTELAPGLDVCSIGCSNGSTPSSTPCRVVGPSRNDDGWEGTETDVEAIEGRSGGALFTADGAIVGVCDFRDPESRTGYYASPASIHRLLRECGVTLDVGRRRQPQAAPEPAAPIAPAPEPRAAPTLPEAIGRVEGAAEHWAVRWVAPSVLPALAAGCVVAASKLRRRLPCPPEQPPGRPAPDGLPTPAEIVPLLMASLKAEDAARARAEHAQAEQAKRAELLDRIKSLVEAAEVPPPNG